MRGEHVCLQEELLGLAELEDSAALARQIDARVLFREGESSRVPASASLSRTTWKKLSSRFVSHYSALLCRASQHALLGLSSLTCPAAWVVSCRMRGIISSGRAGLACLLHVQDGA